jgi:hypothetical protein
MKRQHDMAVAMCNVAEASQNTYPESAFSHLPCPKCSDKAIFQQAAIARAKYPGVFIYKMHFDINYSQNSPPSEWYPGVFIYKMHFDCAQCSTSALKEG